jgi:hypothetical protein
MYLVLKMPSPADVLSLQGDLKISFDWDIEAAELATTNQVPNAMIYAASKKLVPSELDLPEKSDTSNKPQPLEEVQVKRSTLGQATAARLPWSGQALTWNRKTHSSASSGLTETSSLGSQWTCQGCPGGWSSTLSTSTQKLPQNDNTSAVSNPKQTGHHQEGTRQTTRGRLHQRCLPS